MQITVDCIVCDFEWDVHVTIGKTMETPCPACGIFHNTTVLHGLTYRMGGSNENTFKGHSGSTEGTIST